MDKLQQLKKHLKCGQVYRRADLTQWSKSVDRHLDALVNEGMLEKLSQGLYHYPEKSNFGKTPPTEEVMVRGLQDHRFLATSLNAYNAFGVGTTQLYNKKTVYYHKRHGDFTLGGMKKSFRVKPHFPPKVTPEFLLVDFMYKSGRKKALQKFLQMESIFKTDHFRNKYESNAKCNIKNEIDTLN
jgi:hypothetical protein